MEDVVQVLQDLVRMRSDESEMEVVSYLADRFTVAGIPFSIDEVEGAERPNIVAVLGEGEPSIMLNSHTDTVGIGDPDEWAHDPYGAEILDGRMYGRGTSDAKGPLSAMVAAVESVARNGRPRRGRLVLAAVACEETVGMGTEALVAGGLRTQAAVIGEPTSLDVMTAHKGVFRTNITVHGKAVHASEPWNGRNAVVEMQDVVAEIESLSGRIAERVDPLLGRASLAITLIAGGIARNVIPPSCTISIDRRFLPAEKADEVREEIRTALDALGGRIDLSIEPVSVAESAATGNDEPVVLNALRARDIETGTRSTAKGFGACCDMWHLKNTGGIPTVILGPGSLGQAHTVDESIAVAELEQAVRIYRRIVLEWLSGGT